MKDIPNDTDTFAHFTGIAIDGTALAANNYTATAGSVEISLYADYLESLAAGSHTIRADFSDGSAETKFTIDEAAPAIVPAGFDDVAVPSDTFTFRKVWEGGSKKSIDFTLYKQDGTVYHHGVDKKTVSKSEWQYNAWFSTAAACYVIEEPVPGYRIRYENVGVYAGITDRCCNGGTIVNYRVPQTGDDANLTLWLSCVLAGLTIIFIVAYAEKRKKARSK